MSSMKSQAISDWRRLARHIALGMVLLATVAIAAWATDSIVRSAGWALGVLAAAIVVGGVAIGALVGTGGNHLSRDLALGLAALSMLVYGEAIALQWDSTPGSLDCPGAYSCEAGFAVGGIVITVVAIPVGVVSCFVFHKLVRRTRQKFRP